MKYRITVMMNTYEDENTESDNYSKIAEDIHAALDEYGEILSIRYEDEYCIKNNDLKV